MKNNPNAWNESQQNFVSFFKRRPPFWMLFLGGGVFGVAVAGLLLPDVLITRVVGLMFGMTCVMVLKIKNLI